MRDRTRQICEEAHQLGLALGFDVRREVSDSVLALRLDGAYTPRVDLLWSVGLSDGQANAIGEVTGHEPERLLHLPVVGIEVEGTTPSTKTMAANVANIAALGTKLGLLIVSEESEKGIYRRAARAIRTVRRSFGDIGVVPMDASWLRQVSGRSWSAGRSAVVPPPSRSPAGGERLDWTASTRSWLRQLGTDAGFTVAEPYIPGVLNATFEAERRRRRDPLRHLVDPLTGNVDEMRKTGDFLTECQIDLAWLLPFQWRFENFWRLYQHWILSAVSMACSTPSFMGTSQL
ncbi:hypothetical protein [Polyangium sp. 15x6]|uniref:hypothetical protein n=1 Tax=Polyangium sp. 15x6 TaxID=3042687 RepID=UPI00249BF1FF|nr:hypothetical protein [Polyangium sp. 15x6]MDI3291882.1 hypothetical protein [Polyangium sp. 15x6]